MNLHPIFVHFPIALLTLYALFECIRFRKITSLSFWFPLKASFVILGTLASYIAFLTGQAAQRLITDRTIYPLIHLHERFAEASILIFTICAGAYLVAWFKTIPQFSLALGRIPVVNILWKIGLAVEPYIIETPIVIICAIAGLILLTIAGALGGAIVYGFDIDPITQLVGALFHLTP